MPLDICWFVEVCFYVVEKSLLKKKVFKVTLFNFCVVNKGLSFLREVQVMEINRGSFSPRKKFSK